MKTHKDVLEEAKRLLEKDEELRRFVVLAALVEGRGYKKWTRVEEVVEFARLIGARKIGIACCFGLKAEGKILTEVLQRNGFEVRIVLCKCGGMPKEEFGIKDEDKVRPGRFEAICNSVGQALLLNHEETDLNVLVGQCVGHDSVLIKLLRAPTVVLIAKDRVLGHNPAAALHLHQSYFKKNLYEDHALKK